MIGIDKIRVLVVAPYEGLKEQILSMADQYDDFYFDIVVADLDEALIKLNNYDLDSYFAIISRGGTAAAIQKHFGRFVFNLEISGLDIMRLIMFARNHPGKSVIIGFDLITRYCRMICDLLQIKIDTYTVENSDDIASVLASLDKNENVLVLGDSLSTKVASRKGFLSFLILSGPESVKHILTEIRNHFYLICDYRKHNNLYRAVQNSSPFSTCIFDLEGKLLPESTVDTAISSELKKYISQISEDKQKNFILNIGINDSYSVKGNILTDENDSEKYIVFYVWKTNLQSVNPAITLLSDYDIDKSDFNIFGMENEHVKTALSLAHKLAPTRSTVLIEGESGTGKTLLAKLIHSESELKNHLFVQVDCSLLDDDGFGQLWTHDLSRILETDTVTLFLKNIHRLSLNDQKILGQYVSVTLKHRLIISSERSLYEMASIGKLDKDMLSSLDFVQIWLPPLRVRKDEIESCFYLLLTKMNQRFGKQIVGIEKTALDLLEGYRWTGNLDQFRQVVSNAIQKETSNYIRKSTVATLLSVYNQAQWSRKAYNGHTLQEIEQDIVIATLQEMNMNQSLAAKKLGISRTTLWRILKNTSINEETVSNGE